MSGFPNRPSRANFGPTFQDERPVTNPEKEVSAGQVNLLFWQVAGMGLVAPKAVITCTVSGGVVTNVTQALAFDPKGEVSKISFAYAEAGRYTFAFSQQYADQLEVDRDLALVGGIVMPMNQSAAGVGVVQLDNGYSGTVRLFNMSGTLTDPSAFVLVLW